MIGVIYVALFGQEFEDAWGERASSPRRSRRSEESKFGTVSQDEG